MFDYFTQELLFHLAVFQAVLLVIVLSNIWITRRARRHSPPREFPMVSILVPARNEERNIAECVQSLLAQDYLYSDGLIEVHDLEGEMFGFSRLYQLLSNHAGSASLKGDALIQYLLSRLGEFTGPYWEQEDDVTIVALDRV